MSGTAFTKYYYANQERMKERSATYRAKNKERVSETNAAYRAANKDRIGKREAAYRKANRARITKQKSEYQAARRSTPAGRLVQKRADCKRYNVTFQLTLKDFQEMPDSCPQCGNPFGTGRTDSPSLDRLVPAMGYVPGNVEWVCMGCNARKRDMTYAEMVAFGRRGMERNGYAEVTDITVQWAAVQMALLLLESLQTSWEYIRGYRDGLCELREGMHRIFGGSLEREP